MRKIAYNRYIFHIFRLLYSRSKEAAVINIIMAIFSRKQSHSPSTHLRFNAHNRPILILCDFAIFF